MSIKQYVLEFLNGEKMIKAMQEGEPEMAKQHQAATIVKFQNGGPSDFRKVKPKDTTSFASQSTSSTSSNVIPVALPKPAESQKSYPKISQPIDPSTVELFTDSEEDEAGPSATLAPTTSSSSSPPSSLSPPENLATSSAPAPGV
ncbi:Protein CBG07810 [Caenorhabditis briggsae]|uniref:Protein CBG07810 n=1 Tax=Caenorhabditis briggsae TaxID=6238 RepID=A8X577_CAEBR|nr:Protein CBG07810 [Caenorhabditis briggsae]CAP27776.2 Protein CBG07810 [Caenorhabditis briggsae]